MVMILLSLLLTLDDALAMVKEKSIDAKIYLIQMKEQQKLNSYGYSSLLPNISSSASKRTSYPGGFNSYSINFLADQDLSLNIWTEGINTYFKNRQVYYSYMENLSNLLLTCVNYYMEAYTSKRLLDVRKTEVKRTGYYKDKVEEMKSLGSASRADLLKAEVSYYQAKIDYEEAKKSYREAMMNLKYLLKLGVDDSLELTAPLSEIQEIPLDSLKKIAYRERPDVKSLKEEIRTSKIDLVSNILSYLPSINLSGNYGYAASKLPDTKEEWDNNDSYSISLSLSLPLFSGFKRVNNTIIQRLKIKMAELELEKKKDQVDIEIEDAYYSLKEAKNMLELSKKNLELARESAEASRLRYQLREASIIELLKGEEDLLNAEYSYENSVKGYILSIYKLKKAIGRL